MADLLDIKLRALADALVEEAPEPHPFGEFPVVRADRRRRPPKTRTLIAAACVIAIAVGAVALTRTLGDNKDRSPVSSHTNRTAKVGQSATVGPLTVRIKQAVSTVTPHTYVLTMSIKNRGSKPSPLPAFLLGCKAPLVPAGFGITGFVLSDKKLAPRESRSGDVTLYPQQTCEDPTVTISRHLVEGPQDRVTYVLSGLL